MTVWKANIEVTIPKKHRLGSKTQSDKAWDRFHELVMQAIVKHVDFAVVKCVIIASPAFVKDKFYDWMMAEAVKRDGPLKPLRENKSAFCLVHTSNGHRHAMREVLADPACAKRLADTKAAGEVKALEEFFEMMKVDPDRASYGPKHVERCSGMAAIDTLMVTDELIRSSSVERRREYVALVEATRASGGRVLVFSSLHASGEQLSKLSGVAATLRFPVVEEDSGGETSDEDSDSDEEAGPAGAGFPRGGSEGGSRLGRGLCTTCRASGRGGALLCRRRRRAEPGGMTRGARDARRPVKLFELGCMLYCLY